jgi:hypothetical protein
MMIEEVTIPGKQDGGFALPLDVKRNAAGQGNLGERECEAPRREWQRPVLRKLPIAATAGVKEGGNEGSGGGKGDAGGSFS